MIQSSISNVEGICVDLRRIIVAVPEVLLGIYFTGVFFYLLFNAVIPLTTSSGWRGTADVIAVGFYLLGIVPLGGLALMGLGLIGKNRDDHSHLKLHATFVAVFLIVAHVAMIFGMLNPSLLRRYRISSIVPLIDNGSQSYVGYSSYAK